MNHDDDVARLRRRLRAMAAVNEQLRVQLEVLREASAADATHPSAVAPAPARPPARLRPATRRAQIAAEWLPTLVADAAERRTSDPRVVSRADRAVYVVEGGTRRRVPVPVIALALEAVYGQRRPVDDDEFHGLVEGPPVEVLEGPTGGPFVVVGGRRLSLRGLSLPHAVDQEVLDALPEGPPLDLRAVALPRRGLIAADWVGPLTTEPVASGSPAADAHLVTSPEGEVVVVDGRLRRSVPAGLLVPALESVLGQRRSITDDELARLDEGPPVEVLEGRAGTPFVVIGGRRLPVTGLPLPYPVERSALDGLPEGPALDAPASVQPRRAHAAAAWIDQLAGPPPAHPPEIVTSDGKPYVRDGAVFRRITSGLLLPPLEGRLGPRRPATDDELAAWVDGPPVEVIEAPSGPPFVVVGGVRIPVRNLPVPNPVRASALDGLPEAPPLDVTAAQREAEKALKAAQAQIEALGDQPGVIRATAKMIRRKPTDPPPSRG